MKPIQGIIKKYENLFGTPSSIFSLPELKDHNVGGAYVEIYFRRNGIPCVISALFSNNNFKWVSCVMVKDGERKTLSEDESKTVLSEIMNENVLMDVYILDQVGFKEALLEVFSKSTLEDESENKSESENKRISDKSELDIAPSSISIKIEGGLPERISKVIETFPSILSKNGVKVHHLKVTGSYKKFPLGDGGVLTVSIFLEGKPTKRFSKLFDFESFVMDLFKSYISREASVVVNVNSVSFKKLE